MNWVDQQYVFCQVDIGTAVESEKIIQYLKENELFENSVIIITSDHGEAFFEHGACDHGFTLYNEDDGLDN